MAPGAPLTRLALGASSVADDLGYVALDDLARALEDIAADYRVIGGHMVTMLAARWQLGTGLYRETGDVDLGIPPIVARDKGIVSRLKDISYLQVGGNRFARRLSDIPVGMTGESDSPSPEALIDVLVPTYTSRTRENVRVGEDLFTTEVLGLQLALARPPVTISLELRRLNGLTLRCDLPFADELSALILKSLATRVRSKDTDIGDVWRCLELRPSAVFRSKHVTAFGLDTDPGILALRPSTVRGNGMSKYMPQSTPSPPTSRSSTLDNCRFSVRAVSGSHDALRTAFCRQGFGELHKYSLGGVADVRSRRWERPSDL